MAVDVAVLLVDAVDDRVGVCDDVVVADILPLELCVGQTGDAVTDELGETITGDGELVDVAVLDVEGVPECVGDDDGENDRDMVGEEELERVAPKLFDADEPVDSEGDCELD